MKTHLFRFQFYMINRGPSLPFKSSSLLVSADHHLLYIPVPSIQRPIQISLSLPSVRCRLCSDHPAAPLRNGIPVDLLAVASASGQTTKGIDKTGTFREEVPVTDFIIFLLLCTVRILSSADRPGRGTAEVTHYLERLRIYLGPLRPESVRLRLNKFGHVLSKGPSLLCRSTPSYIQRE